MLFIIWAILGAAAAVSMATSCTLSYQTICTHGTTEGVADEDQNASPDVKTDVTANVSAVPKIPVITGPAGPK